MSRTSTGRVRMLRRTVEAAMLANEIGRTPLEVMLANMNFFMNQAEALQERAVARGQEKAVMANVIMFREKAQKCAEGASPYVHPRLAAVTQNLNVRSLRELQGALQQLTDDQLDNAIAELESKVGVPGLPAPEKPKAGKAPARRQGSKKKGK